MVGARLFHKCPDLTLNVRIHTQCLICEISGGMMILMNTFNHRHWLVYGLRTFKTDNSINFWSGFWPQLSIAELKTHKQQMSHLYTITQNFLLVDFHMIFNSWPRNTTTECHSVNHMSCQIRDQEIYIRGLFPLEIRPNTVIPTRYKHVMNTFMNL